MNNLETGSKNLLNKVPEITIFFWIIKVLCTTVGETASDFLNVGLGLGLTGTSIFMGIIFLIIIFFQIKSRKYIPVLYWLTVVLISIFGTLVTDNMTDKIGIPLEVSTIVFSLALAVTFIIWFISEKTLSIHSIFTRKREIFYWAAILFTFALGTASGDLMAERLGLGYLTTGIIIISVIISVTIVWKAGLDSILSFWIAYIMTRPLGASFGDFLSQPNTNGGLGLGATITSMIFLSLILLTVLFLSISKMDLIPGVSNNPTAGTRRKSVVYQVAVTIAVLIIASGFGYYMRYNKIRNETASVASSISPLGDLSVFLKISEDALNRVKTGDMSTARSRVTDLETDWDKASSNLRSMNSGKWTLVDRSIDDVLRQLRAVHQDPGLCRSSLEKLIALFISLDRNSSSSPDSK